MRVTGMETQNTFIIVRLDLDLDPTTVVTESLLIGRLLECELLLNHPSVSRTQAGIKEVEDNFYVFNLRPSNPFKLNGKQVERNEALADGDVLEIGPFILAIRRAGDALVIEVTFQIGIEIEHKDVSSPLLGTQRLPDIQSILAGQKKRPAPRAEPLPGTKALDIYWDKRTGKVGKMMQPSTLFPHAQRRTGKALSYWTATTDLARRWPLPLLFWGAFAVGLFALASAYWYADAYAPAPLSAAHARPAMTLAPAIAARPNANSCTTCHALTAKVEQRCASCHQAEGFTATVIAPHVAAGIGCVDCHAEHRGADFRPAVSAFTTCAACHNDQNKKLYNGRRVTTPHGGTLGYPVAERRWRWRGLSDEEWSLKGVAVTRLAGETDDAWRSKQFHALHLYRVRAATGLESNSEGEMSCSSCHQSFNPIDRETPRTTCAACHTNRQDPRIIAATDTTNATHTTDATRATLDASMVADAPGCTTCHIQHIRNTRHWNPALLTARSSKPD